MRYVLFGLIAYWAWKTFIEEKVIEVEGLPPGARTTGRTQRTTNTAPPGWPIPTVGFALRDFVEVEYADGSKKWVEVKATELGNAQKVK